MARFDQVASCTSSLAWTRQVFAGSAADDITAPAHIASYACHFNPGIGRDALGDLSNHIRGVMGASDAFKGYASYGLVPITGDADRPDYVVFNVTDDAQGWATGQKAIYTTEGGQSLLRHFNTILDCSTAIWTGERVIGEG